MERVNVFAKQVLSQLSYTPTVEVTFILKHFQRFQNPLLRIFVTTVPEQNLPIVRAPRKFWSVIVSCREDISDDDPRAQFAADEDGFFIPMRGDSLGLGGCQHGLCAGETWARIHRKATQSGVGQGNVSKVLRFLPRRGWKGERSSGHGVEATAFGPDDSLGAPSRQISGGLYCRAREIWQEFGRAWIVRHARVGGSF
jgi:hypothetical protein